MSASSFNISLSEPSKAHVDARVKVAGFASPSDYIEGLVNQDRVWHSPAMEERLVAAVVSPDLDISQDEWDSRPLVGLLREKLEQQA